MWNCLKVCRGDIYSKFFKRPFDFILSLAAIVLLSPVLLAIVITLVIKLGRPVIFKQERPGVNEKIFTMYKFRTMTDERDGKGNLLSDEDRLTRFGIFLRGTSLDELPELFNILKGDMSFVGPRPLLTEYLPLYNEQQRRRHDLRPGMSGLAQVSGRNAITWEEKFNLDIEYVDNVTFLGDLRIIMKTVKIVLLREGITPETAMVMEAFKGSGVNEKIANRH